MTPVEESSYTGDLNKPLMIRKFRLLFLLLIKKGSSQMEVVSFFCPISYSHKS